MIFVSGSIVYSHLQVTSPLLEILFVSFRFFKSSLFSFFLLLHYLTKLFRFVVILLNLGYFHLFNSLNHSRWVSFFLCEIGVIGLVGYILCGDVNQLPHSCLHW